MASTIGRVIIITIAMRSLSWRNSNLWRKMVITMMILLITMMKKHERANDGNHDGAEEFLALNSSDHYTSYSPNDKLMLLLSKSVGTSNQSMHSNPFSV